MKKFNSNFAYGAAALLVGTMAFTACSSSDDVADVNPSFDGKNVKTQFAINIPVGGNPGTRMSANNTQENNHFLGMYDVKLIPLTAPGKNGLDFVEILPLDAFSGTEGGTGAAWTDDKGVRKIYSDVSIPVGTKNFLLYAAGGTAAPDDTNKSKLGIINATVSSQNTDGISFALRTVRQDVSPTTDEEAAKMLTVLNAVAGAEGWATSTDDDLSKLYTEFTSLKAGSSNTIMMALQNLYMTLQGNIIPVKTGDALTIANAIKKAIDDNGYFTITGTTLSNPNANFPGNISMPDGSVLLSFDTTSGKFSYTDGDVLSTPTFLKQSEICYPASIYYFINTPLWASDNSSINNWPATLSDWTGTGFSGWGTEVAATTRTIALKDPVQYGVAKLAMDVKCANSSLEDASTPAKNITVATVGFPVTAVLIGDQPVKSNWDFYPAGEDTEWTRVVYDSDVNDVNATVGTSTGVNYSLVMDNSQITKTTEGVITRKTTQSKVTVAVEMLNNSGYNFMGKDGIIYSGSKFYMLAELDPKSTVVGEVTNKPNENASVFMQDYTTKAHFTIKNLKNAYNVIPDMRTSKIELGLAVNLEWQAGITFDVELGSK